MLNDLPMYLSARGVQGVYGTAVAEQRTIRLVSDAIVPKLSQETDLQSAVRWYSRATASRWAVGRASPVLETSWARVAGPASRALRTSAALSRTPTPLDVCSSIQLFNISAFEIANCRIVKQVKGASET